MNHIIKFGEDVKGFNISVLNEREIRAAAGIMFLATFISWIQILFEGNFVPIKYVLTIFLSDFSIRLFISPKFSPILIIGRLIVSNQNPEYVGAKQKMFAWYIGLILSATMFVLMAIFNTYSYITGIVCLLCLILMFFETAFGICLGCKVYKLFYKERAQYCPGEVCELNEKHEIQKVSKNQIFVFFTFVSIVFIAGILFNEKLNERPRDLFQKHIKSKVTQP